VYEVVVKLSETDMMDTFICKDAKKQPSHFYTLLCVKSPEMIREVTPIVPTLAENERFTDFTEFFVSEGMLYVVFEYAYQTEAMQFDAVLGGMYLKDRLTLCRSLLAKLFMQDVPYGVLCEVLLPENIIVPSASTVHFNYFLRRLSADANTKDKAMVMLSLLLRRIFAPEYGVAENEKLNTFVNAVGQNEYDSMQAVYAAFAAIYDDLLSMQDLTVAEKPTWWSLMLDFLFRLLTKLRPLLAVLIIGVGLYYLYVTLFASPPVTMPPGSIKAIGHMEIQENGTEASQ